MSAKLSASIAFIFLAVLSASTCAQQSGMAKEDADRAASDAKYFEWKRRAAERQTDIAPLRDALLFAGGTSLSTEKNWPEFPKGFLLAAETSELESFQGFKGTSILGKWKKVFEEWCENNGGKPSTRNTSSNVREYLAIRITMHQNPQIEGKDVTSLGGLDRENHELGCFDKDGLSFGFWDKIAQLVLLGVDRQSKAIKSSQETRAVYLFGLADHHLKESTLVLRETRAKKSEADRAAYDKEQQTDQAARSEWQQRSLLLQNQLKTGDSAIVLLDIDKRTIAASVLVVEVKRPIAYVQFSNVQPPMRWVKIEEIRSPPIPDILTCKSRLRTGCIQ